jgi:hypothetical protein
MYQIDISELFSLTSRWSVNAGSGYTTLKGQRNEQPAQRECGIGCLSAAPAAKADE